MDSVYQYKSFFFKANVQAIMNDKSMKNPNVRPMYIFSFCGCNDHNNKELMGGETPVNISAWEVWEPKSKCKNESEAIMWMLCLI